MLQDQLSIVPILIQIAPAFLHLDWNCFPTSFRTDTCYKSHLCLFLEENFQNHSSTQKVSLKMPLLYIYHLNRKWDFLNSEAVYIWFVVLQWEDTFIGLPLNFMGGNLILFVYDLLDSLLALECKQLRGTT